MIIQQTSNKTAYEFCQEMTTTILVNEIPLLFLINLIFLHFSENPIDFNRLRCNKPSFFALQM